MTAFSARDDAGARPLTARLPGLSGGAVHRARAIFGRPRTAAFPPPIWPCMSCCPRWTAASFWASSASRKPQPRDAAAIFAPLIHAPDPDLIAAVARVAVAPAARPAPRRAVMLSTYPGKAHQLAHAVGLDALASCGEILGIPHQDLGPRLMAERHDMAAGRLPCRAGHPAPAPARRPAAAWGAPETDPLVRDGAFRFRRHPRDDALIALQPERGEAQTRADDYHDLSRTPRHAYVAFYLWLRHRPMR
jgi:cobaltochelatase CobN